MAAGEEIALQVMPMIQMEGEDWNNTAGRVLGIGTGAQVGGKECRRRCGID
jgi:hypothetical protein